MGKNFNVDFFTRRLLSRDLLVKGYYFICFENISPIINTHFKNLDDYDISVIYNSQCFNVTLPDEAIKFASFSGKVGYTQEVPVGLSKGNRISFEFNLTQDENLLGIHNMWYQFIKAMFAGTEADAKADYARYASIGRVTQGLINNLREYSATFHYILMNPSLEFQFGFVGYGVAPIKMISDELSSSQAVESAKVTLQYKVDYWTVYHLYDEHYKKVFTKSSIINKMIKEMKDKFKRVLK